MTKLVSGIETPKGQGSYNFKVVSTTGDVKLQYRVSDEGFTDIEGATFTGATDTGVTVDLPSCILKAVITGDGVAHLNLIR